MTSRSYLIQLLFVLLVFSGCIRQLNREEADRSLKVLNSNLVNFITLSSEKPEIKALWFLLNEPSSPLTLVQKRNFLKRDTITNIQEKSKGIFQFNIENHLFEKTDSSDQTILIFPSDGKNGEEARFVLSEFESQDCKTRPEFPVKIVASMFINDNEKLTINHRAVIEDNLPLESSSLISGDDYKVTIDLARTRMDKAGTLDLDVYFKAKGFTICSATIDAKIEYSRQGYYFRFFDFRVKLFEHEIIGKLDYSKIDPTASDYVDLFNRYSSMELFENNGNKVGNIILGKSVNSELLDYYIQFENGDKVLVSEYIPLLSKILDYKY